MSEKQKSLVLLMSMEKRKLKKIIGWVVIISLVVFFMYQRWLVIDISTRFYRRGPTYKVSNVPASRTAKVLQKQKKTVRMYYPKQGMIFQQFMNIEWFDNTIDNLSFVTNTWFAFLHDKGLIKQRVVVEIVALNALGEASLSLSNSFISSSWSKDNKLSVVQSLFKTIRHAQIPVYALTFLVKQQPMVDEDFDFSHPWPLA